MNRGTMITNAKALKSYAAMAARGLAGVKPGIPAISVGLGTCGIGNGADTLFDALKDAASDGRVLVKKAGCFGFCAEEPLLMLYRPGKPILLFTDVKAAKAAKFVTAANDDKAYERLAKTARAKISAWDFRTSKLEFGTKF